MYKLDHKFKGDGTGSCWTCGKAYHVHVMIDYAERKAEEAKWRGDTVMEGQWRNAAERARYNMC